MGLREDTLSYATPKHVFLFSEPLVRSPREDMALVLRYRKRSAFGQTVDETKHHPLLELVLTPKGLGLFAKQDIKSGTRILAEAPLVVLPSKDHVSYHKLQLQLAGLSLAQRDTFHSLSSNPEHFTKALKASIEEHAKATRRPLRNEEHLRMEAKKVATFRTNATSLLPAKGFGVFPLFSRINHDCMPNVFASFNVTLGKHAVNVTRDIKAGEELLVSYVDPAQRLRNRAFNLERFGVDCSCSICVPGKAHDTSEKRRKQIEQIVAGLAVYDGAKPLMVKVPDIVPDTPDLALTMAETAIEVAGKEQLVNMYVAKLHRQAAKYALQERRIEKAKSHAQREAKVERICLGEETTYLNDRDVREGGGNAAAWLKYIEEVAKKDQVNIRMCEKREAKERKHAAKKAEKKAAKGKR